MSENEIKVSEIKTILYGKDDAKLIFNEINKFDNNIMVNFQSTFNFGLFFVREYLLLKEESELNISEKLYGAKEVFEFVEKIGYHCSDEDFIQKIKEYDF